MRSGNPALNERTFENYRGQARTKGMTINGTINKCIILFVILFGAALSVWNMHFNGQNVQSYIMIGFIGGGIVGLVTAFVPRIARFTAPVYAGLEGVAIGALSAYYETQFNGIVLQAVMITFSIFIALLLIYKSGLIKVTQNFRMGIFAATLGVALVYLLDIVLRFFGMEVPYLHSNGWIGIGISLFIIVIATLNLVLDFDFIEKGASMNIPKYMEWYAAFGLMVTLVWLYIEVLRLLAKLRSRN